MPRAVRIGARPTARRCCSASRAVAAVARRAAPRPTQRVAAPPADKPGQAPLSEEQALKGSLDMRLAYIVTGDKEVDDISKAGLEGLSEILRNRTSVEPGDPVGLDLETRRAAPLSADLLADHLDPAQPLAARLGRARPLPAHRRHPVHRHARPAALLRPAAGGNPDLKRLLAGIETPPLVVMPPDHVLTKSFYLLSDMPGRWIGGKVWIEVGRRAGQ